MLRKFVIAGLAVFALAACETTPDDEGMDDMMLTPPAEQAPMAETDELLFDDTTTGVPMQDVDSSAMVDARMSDAAPGSQQDLVENVGDRVFFGYDQHDLNTEARATLEKQASWLNTYQNVRVVVEGHADERGTREYNIALSDRRATAVKNYLTALGVAPSRIRTVAFGKERPAVMGSDAVSWARNRRSVMVAE